MSELKKVTAIILTYKTPKNIILNCLKSINRGINIMIVENSKSFEHQKMIKKRFPKIKIFCTGKNLGYGKGNNFGLSKVKTKTEAIISTKRENFCFAPLCNKAERIAIPKSSLLVAIA